MTQRWVCAVLAAAGGCAPTQTSLPVGAAPDVTVYGPTASDTRVMQVVRPSWWIDEHGARHVDPRITVALSVPERGVWECAARVSDTKALVLARTLGEALGTQPLDDSDVTLVASDGLPAQATPTHLSGGGWRVQALDEGVGLHLMSAQGRSLAHVRLGAAAARSMQRSIELAVRASP